MTVSISAIDKFIRQQLGYRYKKPCSPVSESARMWGGSPGVMTNVAEKLRFVEAGLSG